MERDGDGAAQVVHTLTPGYVHAFAVAEYADRPLVLCGLLVQEEFYLMMESDDISEAEAEHYPTGRKHTLSAGVSIFGECSNGRLGLWLLPTLTADRCCKQRSTSTRRLDCRWRGSTTLMCQAGSCSCSRT